MRFRPRLSYGKAFAVTSRVIVWRNRYPIFRLLKRNSIGEEIVANARVDATSHGHMGAYAASLTDIQNITRFLK